MKNHKGKESKFCFTIPNKGTPSTMSVQQIVWRSTGNEGLARSFGLFLKDQMESVVKKWKKVEQMRDWVQTEKDTWRKKVREVWNKQCSPDRPRTRQQLQSQSAMVQDPLTLCRPARGVKTETIPVPIVMAGGKRIAIRVYPRAHKVDKNSRVHKAQVMVYLPSQLYADENKKMGTQISMGVRFGIKETWMSFVVQYIRYTVSKWKTITDCNKWVTKYLHIFKVFTNVLYARSDLYDTDTKCHWEISKSTIELDEAYTHIFGDAPRGYGLFCKVSGKHTFDVNFNDKRISCLLNKKRVKKLQQGYRFGQHDSDTVWVPTMDSLNCGAIQACYIMQHRVLNPTHKLSVTYDDRVCLEPKRPSVVDEEYCFDYNMLSRTDGNTRSKRSVNK